MRRMAEMLLLLFACAGFCSLLDWFACTGTVLISGTVVDWMTRQPVPHVTVRTERLNSSQVLGSTDASGGFSIQVPKADVYRLFADDPLFGRLLQGRFVQTVLAYPRGWQRYTGLVIPAIPATELSGHVYDDESGKPLKGCDVSACILTTGHAPEMLEKEWVTTDAAGAFSFTHLGADRYFLAARCRQYLSGEFAGYQGVGSVPWKVRNSWPPVLLKPISLLPGMHRDDVVFRMRSFPSYSIQGNVIFRDGKPPRAGVVYSHELNTLPADHAAALASQALRREACDWDANRGTFHCDFLAPGSYNLVFGMDGEISFTLSGGSSGIEGPQAAEVRVDVKGDSRPQPPVVVRLHDVRPREVQAIPDPDQGPFGYLRLRRNCAAEKKGLRVQTLAWNGAGEIVRNFFALTCTDESIWPVTPGDYIIASYEQGFVDHSGARSDDRVISLVKQRGTPVTIRAGETTALSLRAVTTDEIVQMALALLRER